MDRDRRVRIYDLHAWTGISLGLIVFIVSFTGCIALFYHELQTWEDPARRLSVPEQPVPINAIVNDWVKEKADGQLVTFFGFEYPSRYEPYYSARIFFTDNKGETSNSSQRWHAQTGAPIANRGDGLTVWLLDFHRDLMWPASLGGRTVGRALVGIVGIVLMLSIISGLVTHRKMLQELFTLRINRSIRLKWKDAHNILGLWGLPFYSMIAFTGAFLGIVALLLPLMGALVAKGETEKLAEVLGIAPPTASAVAAKMLSVDTVYHRRFDGNPHPPESIFVSNWGDESAVYQVNYPADTELLPFESEIINAVSGEPISESGFLERTAVNRTFNAIAPLHYGTYGGIALKLLYFVLGLSLCAMIVLGIMVWLERRLHSPVGTRSESFYRRIARLTIGVTLGNVLASVAVFYIDRLYTGSEEVRINWVGSGYFLFWFTAIVYAWQRDNHYYATRELLAAVAVASIGVAILNSLTSAGFTASGTQGIFSVSQWVDISFVLFAVLTALLAVSIPKNRPVVPHRTESVDDAPGLYQS